MRIISFLPRLPAARAGVPAGLPSAGVLNDAGTHVWPFDHVQAGSWPLTGWLDLDRAECARALARGQAFAHGGDAQGIVPLEAITLIAPVPRPGKLLCIGLNYRDHAAESGVPLPARPLLFSKFPSAIIGHGEAIELPDGSTDVDYEAELAVVIGRRASRVPTAGALEYVFGYTCLNDVSARDFQFADGQWQRGKSCDTFAPMGPWLVTRDTVPDPGALAITCRVNGETRQSSSTRELVFGVADLIAILSRDITLEPGDVIATGTPAGVGFARTPPVYLRNGDDVEVEIEGIGVLRNRVRRRAHVQDDPPQYRVPRPVAARYV